MSFEPREMSLAEFAKITSGTTTADVQSHIHAGLRSAPTTKTYKQSFAKKLEELQRMRDFTIERYEHAIATGIIKRPAKPTREEIAAGDPTLPHVQAARRILEKQAQKEQRDKKFTLLGGPQ